MKKQTQSGFGRMCCSKSGSNECSLQDPDAKKEFLKFFGTGCDIAEKNYIEKHKKNYRITMNRFSCLFTV
uniref:Uncharacterized protein n=1 Tax=Romanomermis culicivorax TaxID=13658 RepID=A0A915HRI1_ROMCU